VGCGNGRLATLLDCERPGGIYLGVDASSDLIEIARGRASTLSSTAADFVVRDVSREGWARGLGAGLFDCVVGLALLHHLPARDLRVRVVRDLALLAKPCGRVIVSTWQFLDSARLRRRIVPWEEVGLREAQVEPGDYLLDWRRGGRGLRYCHLVDERELDELAWSSALRIAETWRVGGREGTLSLVCVLEPLGLPAGPRRGT
jgi:SAM-dependent methyltransferase